MILTMQSFQIVYIYKQHGHQTDCLYLDMNQVIYKCATNPNVLFRDQLRNRNFDEVWATIFNYLNHIINLVGPKKILFMAFDGVAPRAKMNQQRQRRFQSAQRNDKLNIQLQQFGVTQSNETFKNNQISPGTQFMYNLNQQIMFFIKRKFYEDPKWKDLKVIFSGSDVPGEGEHKILQFIRNIKLDQNCSHMIYGADADLIMLGLSTQIKNISIIRENMQFSHDVSIFLYNFFFLKKTQVATLRFHEVVKFQLINLQIVREYFDLEYSQVKSQMKIKYDIDRIIDDFVLLFFFVGNDFLPRIFCFDIRQIQTFILICIDKVQLRNQYVFLRNT